MINILRFPFTPKTCCWVHEPGAGQSLLAVSDMNSPTIRIYDGRGDGKPLYELTKLHRAPVHLMAVSQATMLQVAVLTRLVQRKIRLCRFCGRRGLRRILATERAMGVAIGPRFVAVQVVNRPLPLQKGEVLSSQSSFGPAADTHSDEEYPDVPDILA